MPSASPFRLFFLLALLFLPLLLVQPALAQIPGINLGGGGAAEEEAVANGEVQSALDQLITILRDDAAREALLTELETARGAAPEAAPNGELIDDEAIREELRSIGGQIAEFTSRVVEGAVASARGLFTQLAALPQVISDISPSDIAFFGWLVVNLAALIVVTYGGLFVMALATDRVRERLRISMKHEGFIARALAVIATLIIDVIRAVVPWAIGYGVALALLGTPGQVAYPHHLYLNAFLVLELFMAVLRTILAPNRAEARMVTLKTPQAKAVTVWSRVIASVLIYGQLVLLPLMTRNVSPTAGRVAAILGLALVLLLVGIAITRMRGYVARKMVRVIGRSRGRRGLRALARVWHLPILLYLAGLFIVALSRPIEGFYEVIWANAQIAGVIVAGVLVTNMITRMIGAGVRLPPEWKARVPLLEERLNAFIPKMLWVVRAVVVVVVVAWCVHLLGLVDVLAFLESDTGLHLTGSTITIVLILVVGFLLWLMLSSWVDFRINPDNPVLVSARERTLLVLMRNALTIALVVIILMFVLSEIGLNIAPLLASAGVIGLAIGFGAQKLVQDIITGVFIQLEGAIDVGDVVQIGGISGVVERLTVRSAGLRDVEGNYHLIPFSSVDIVTNFMRGFSFALIDMGIAYREDVEEARVAMIDAFEELRNDPDNGPSIIGEFEWFGVNEFGSSEVVVRGRIKTMPGKQWAVKRAYNGIIKRIFDERGIEISFPHQTVYFGEDKHGKAPPLHVVGMEPARGRSARQGAAPSAGSQSEAQPQPQRHATPPSPPPSEFQALAEDEAEEEVRDRKKPREGRDMPDVEERPEDDGDDR